jgi:hypothetical protein
MTITWSEYESKTPPCCTTIIHKQLEFPISKLNTIYGCIKISSRAIEIWFKKGPTYVVKEFCMHIKTSRAIELRLQKVLPM